MILVTGGTGFLGRHLVQRLLDDGDPVRVLARSQDDGLTSAGAECVRGSVLDAEAVARAMEGVTAVYHCAGLVSRDRDHAAQLHRVHVQGTRKVLQAAHDVGVKRVVVASTSGTVAVSENAEPIPDETFQDPIELIGDWPYYTSKLYQEKAAFRLGEDLGLEVVAVNPTLLLGPGDERLSSTTDVLNFLQRKIPTVPAGGISFVDARDAAEAMVLAMEKGRPGSRYLVTAANLTFGEFFLKLEGIADVPAPRVLLPEGATKLGAKLLEKVGGWVGYTPPVDPVSAAMSEVFWYADDRLARDELGWNPRDPHETLADTVFDLKRRGEWEPKDVA